MEISSPNAPHPGVIYDGDLDVPTERSEAIVRAFKKAWQTFDRLEKPLADRTEVPVYMLGIAGYTDGVLLAYDFAEVAAFLGGVADGEFDDLLEEPSDEELQAALEEQESAEESEEPEKPAIDWDAIELPPGISFERLTQLFRDAAPSIHFEEFGGEGGPAWGRIIFNLSYSESTQEYSVTGASVEPPLNVPEIRAIAHLPFPVPTEVALKAYMPPETLTE